MNYSPSIFWRLSEELFIYPKTIIFSTYIIAFFSLLFIVSDGYQPFFLVNESLSIPNKNKWVADASIIYTITLIIIFIFRATFLFISNDTKEIIYKFKFLKFLDNSNKSLKDIILESTFIFIICLFYFDTVFFGFQPSPSSLSVYNALHSSVYFYCLFSLGLCYFFAILFFYGLFNLGVNFYEHEM